MTKTPKYRISDEPPEAAEFSSNRRLAPPSADMNVTPLIDVLLVLLVIFMAALPLTQKGSDINLPLESTATSKPDATQVVAEYSADHLLSLNKQVVTIDELTPRLRALFENRTDKTIFVVGDPNVRYGEMMPIIDAAIGIGLKVAIVTEGMKEEALSKRGG